MGSTVYLPYSPPEEAVKSINEVESLLLEAVDVAVWPCLVEINDWGVLLIAVPPNHQ
jgi:hypothetical protein